MKYTTAAEVKAYPAIPADVADAFINACIDRASAYITKRTGRTFGYDPAANPAVPYEVVTAESHNVQNWGGFYIGPDVQAISAISLGGYAYTDYEFDKATGRLYIGNRSGEPVLVSYTRGYKGVPDDIKYATEALVIAMYQGLGGKGAVNSVRTGNYQVSYNTSKVTMPNPPPDAEDIIRQYRYQHI